MDSTDFEWNEKQKACFDAFENRQNVYIGGAAGVGKSAVMKEIIKRASQKNLVCEVTASTGIAAVALGGATLHSFAGIGLGDKTNNEHNYVRTIRRNEITLGRWTNCDVLIIDEVSMVTPQFFSLLNTLAKLLRKKPQAFGGMQVILVGDFCQLQPINKNKQDPIKFIFQTEAWTELALKHILLERVYRQQNGEWIDMLHEIRMGHISNEAVKLIQKTSSNELRNDLGIQPTILFPFNKNVEHTNNERLNSLPGEATVFEAIDSFSPTLEQKQKEQHEKTFMFRKVLKLKPGAQVMLLKNLDPKAGLVNGSRGVVKEILPDKTVRVVMTNGKEEVFGHAIHENKCPNTDNLLSSRKQIPLSLAWATTIHKSQGLTLDLMQVNLKGCFANAQVYVALSRGRSLDTMRVINFHKKMVRTDPIVKDFYESIKNNTHIKKNKKRKSADVVKIEQFFNKKYKQEKQSTEK